MPKPRRRKVFRPLSPVTRSKYKRLEEDEIYDGIMTAAENADSPLAQSAIHEHIGGPDVCSLWDVRRCLFNMQDNKIMKKIGEDSWILYEKYDAEENNNEVQAENPVLMNDAICTMKLKVTNKLLSFMSRQEAKSIGEIAAALGEEQSGISRLLHFLENKKVVSKMPNNKWILLHDFKDIEVSELRNQIPNIFENEDHTPVNEDCMCPNAGDRCNHVHLHCNQLWTVNNYVQTGNINRMYTGHYADFHHTYQRPF